MSKISVVIAAYDEEENIEELTRRLDATLSALAGRDWELLFVVEGRDRTRQILERLSAELGHIRLLYEEEPKGLGNAFRRGFAAIPPDADLVVTLDADLNHQPEEIPRLIAALERSGADILVGSRFLEGSRVEGTPVWKRVLSGLMNRIMGRLYGIPVLDKTSGFRIFRAGAARTLEWNNPNFAFLPEILIRAHKAGLRIEEEPIEFVFRRQGESKLRFWPTSLSYLSLLRARFDRWSLAALLLLLAGMAVRAAVAFPVHKYPADADGLLAGLCAFKVLRGETPVFFSYTRIGSLECHLAAGLFFVFGATRATLLGLGFALHGLGLGVGYLFTRELLGRKMACVALAFLALPGPSYLFWSYIPNGYPTTLLLCALVLWQAARLGKKERGRRGGFALGIAVGLGWWHSLQTVACSAPALLWLAGCRRDLLRNGRFLALVTLGVVLGAAPWIAFNLKWPLASLQNNFTTRPADGVEAVLDNARYLLTYSMPELLASLDPENGVNPPLPVQRRLRPAALAIYAAAFLYFLLLPLLPARARPREGVPLASWAFLALTALFIVAVNLFSEAGQTRGLTVRYVLPMQLVVPAVLAVFLAAAARWSRPAAVALAAVVLVLCGAGYQWPGRVARERWEQRAEADEQLRAALEKREIQAIAGGYWTVYPIGFLSSERVLGISCEDRWDVYRYGERLPDDPLRWALVAWTRAGGPTWIEIWQGRTGLPGTWDRSVPGYVVFYPRQNPPPQAPAPKDFLHWVRGVCEAQPY